MLNPWLSVALILTILGGLMVGLRLLQHFFSPHPELVRKLLHIPMGLITLGFPWLFDAPLPVVVLGVLAVSWLMLLRFYRPLSKNLGTVLGGVKRRSLGEVYFPLSVVILFVLSQGKPLLYCIPILVLTLADAIAALIGVRYGQVHYTTAEGQKSAEGSLSFFMTTFFSVHIPLLLFSPTGRAETLLISLILGLLVMLLEAIAWQGLDNLFIPLGCFILLKTHLAMDVNALLVRLVVTVGLVVFVLLWRRRTTLNDSALLGAAFIGYLSWTLGGWHWLIPPLIVLITYPLFVSWVNQQQHPLSADERQVMLWLPSDPAVHPRQWERVHNIHAVISVCAAGLLWLVLFGIFNRSELLYPYVLGFAANLAVVGVAGLSPVGYWNSARWGAVVVHSLKAWLLVVLPMWVLVGLSMAFSVQLLVWAGVSLMGTMGAAIAYYIVQPQLRQRPTDSFAWVCRALLTTLSSFIALLSLAF